MKKEVLLIVSLLVASIASAASYDWWYYGLGGTSATPITAPELASEPGSGVNWYVALFSGTTEIGSKSVLANAGGTLYVAAGTFGTAIAEGEDIFFRIYNDTSVPSGSYWQIDSQLVTLPTFSSPPSSSDLEIGVTFSGQTWQAVPEPATALLFGIGGLGAFIVRRNKQKAQEEADA